MNLFKGRKFYPIFWTQFFGAFNDNFLRNALIILVTFRSASVFGLTPSEIVALAGGIFIFPFFLFSALAGQIADKYEKGRVVRIVKISEIAIMVLASYGLVTEHYELLLIVLFLMGLHSTFFGPIKYSILPQHLGEKEIVAGNALVEAGTFIAILLGTIAGGVLITRTDGPLVVSVGLITCALIGFLFSLLIPSAPAVDGDLKVELNPFPPTWQMFGFARKSRTVFLSIIGISWFWLFGAALLSLFAPLCKDVLHADENVVTLFLAIFSVGVATGSILCERLSRKRLELGLVPLGSIGISFLGIGLYWLCAHADGRAGVTVAEFLSSRYGRFILTDLFLLSVFSGFFIVPLYTLVQARSEARERSRVIAANNVLNAFFMVLSSVALVGLLQLKFSIPEIILILSLLNGIASIYVYSLLPEFLLRFLVWILAILIYRLKVEGDENIPKHGPVLLICNHISFIDWMIIAAAVRRPPRFVMSYKYFEIPGVRSIAIRAKVIPIAGAKEDPQILENAFKQVALELSHKQVVCIFPEGTITYNGELSVFKPGVLRILAETPVPVVPMALNGLWGSIFSRKDRSFLEKRPRKFGGVLKLRIGKPIPPENVTVELLRSEVEKLLD
jgi:hypothetical protein